MKDSKVVEIINIEKQCVLRNKFKKCDRQCDKCDLVLNDEDIILAYNKAIKAVEDKSKYRKKAKRFKNKYLHLRNKIHKCYIDMLSQISNWQETRSIEEHQNKLNPHEIKEMLEVHLRNIK